MPARSSTQLMRCWQRDTQEIGQRQIRSRLAPLVAQAGGARSDDPVSLTGKRTDRRHLLVGHRSEIWQNEDPQPCRQSIEIIGVDEQERNTGTSQCLHETALWLTHHQLAVVAAKE